ncbi:MAG: hypothetical protein NT118_15555 [Lentisphaerae bacterium]|nr:hypothetical protein [Lentisphaerota bacterium]
MKKDGKPRAHNRGKMFRLLPALTVFKNNKNSHYPYLELPLPGKDLPSLMKSWHLWHAFYAGEILTEHRLAPWTLYGQSLSFDIQQWNKAMGYLFCPLTLRLPPVP